MKCKTSPTKSRFRCQRNPAPVRDADHPYGWHHQLLAALVHLATTPPATGPDQPIPSAWFAARRGDPEGAINVGRMGVSGTRKSLPSLSLHVRENSAANWRTRIRETPRSSVTSASYARLPAQGPDTPTTRGWASPCPGNATPRSRQGGRAGRGAVAVAGLSAAAAGFPLLDLSLVFGGHGQVCACAYE
jgi:hypothetical protein